jgi:cbb3-type cytochrome oxidase subunit 3
MTHTELIAASKIISMLIFLPTFLGFTIYAYWRPNKEKLQAHASIPFLDD